MTDPVGQVFDDVDAEEFEWPEPRDCGKPLDELGETDVEGEPGAC